MSNLGTFKGKYFRTQNVDLAACLFTLGFEEPPSDGSSRIVGDGISGEIIVWTFLPVSVNGAYTVNEVLTKWYDTEWLLNPAVMDPLAFLIQGYRNRQTLLDRVKQSKPYFRLKVGHRQALFRQDVGQNTMDKIEKHLMGVK